MSTPTTGALRALPWFIMRKHAKQIKNLVPIKIVLSFYNSQFEPDAGKQCLFKDCFSSKNCAIIIKNA